MNSYAISPVPMSDVAGSDFAGRWCTFEWEEDFPYTGEYVFRGMADNIGRIYLDNDRIMETRFFRGDPLPSDIIKKTVTEGVHKIKVELFNVPIKETIVNNNTQDSKEKVPVDFEVYGQGSEANTSINMVFTYEDGSHSFTFKPEKDRGKKYDYKRTVRVLPNTQYKVQAVATGTLENKTEKTYPIRTEGASRTAGRKFIDNKKIRFDDDINNGFDRNATLKIESTSPGVDAKFSDDAKELIVKGNGEVSLKFSWDDNPRTKGLSVGTLKIGRGDKVSATFRPRGEKGSDKKTISPDK